MSAAFSAAAQIELSNCDHEPIHIPGSVQPHGALVVASCADLRITQVSSNTDFLLHCPAESLLGLPIDEFLSDGVFDRWQQEGRLERLASTPVYLPPAQVRGGSECYEASICQVGGSLLLQLEPYLPDAQEESHSDALLETRSVLLDLQKSRSLLEFCDLAAASIRRETGYDRVMVYRFLRDYSGEVIGESKRADLSSWMGLRYPASDIPAQARQLYLQSWLRIIADVNAQPSPMVPQVNPTTGAPLDMSHCIIRSVSPVHIQYLKNMGVQASMSLSLIQNDKLWGLIACHHQTPRQLPQAARIVCEFIAHSVSLQVGAKEDSENFAYSSQLRANVRKLTENITPDTPFQEALLANRPDVLSLFRAGGAAVLLQGNMHLRGLTPPAQSIQPLLSWLKRQQFREGVFTTNRLSEAFPEAKPYASQASGLLAMRIEEAELQWLLWFRPEMVQVVNWAGDPRKPVEADSPTGLSPRYSFALWKEEKRGLSEPWLTEEVRIAVELRRALVEEALKRVQRLQRANADLRQSNGELESFACAASHDLREPLRGIQTYAQLLKRSLGARLTPKESEDLETMLRLSSRMDELIDSLLAYSRVDNLELAINSLDANELVNESLVMLKHQLEQCGVSVRVPRPLPVVASDPVRLREVFQNLITNAVKYNDKPEKWIEIGYVDSEPLAFYVRDNGIGIPARHHESIFRIFKRLHGEAEFGGGTGAGLTIAQRVVERLGGKMWLDSTPGEGSTFFFTVGK